jgi:leucyl/phenylalanyl-tRNA---protein transferase
MNLSCDELLHAYTLGYFPMAMSRADPNLYWFNPDPRAILPLKAVHIPGSLQRLLKKHPYRFTLNQAFEDVMLGCAENRDESWINPAIIRLYGELHRRGHAISLEVWADKGHTQQATGNKEMRETYGLIGGIYGVAIGGAFFGESMFSRVTNASKLALVILTQALSDAGYTLFDVQYQNDHIRQFGVIEIPREEYLRKLKAAVASAPNVLRL